MNATRVIATGIAAIAMICTSATAVDSTNLKPDAAVRFNAFMPSQEEDWDGATGVEAQARFWSDSNFGIALSAGIDSWRARKEYSEQSDDAGTIASSIYGNMTLLPVGASLLIRNHAGNRLTVILEAGVRYVFTDSGINAETGYPLYSS